ncbi:unnamed protein product [Amoebophrya sp. A120]|nr:unnamed protein product [Amoebophrya sp. A120]|eukprot:GSA120T00015594001.1
MQPFSNSNLEADKAATASGAPGLHKPALQPPPVIPSVPSYSTIRNISHQEHSRSVSRPHSRGAEFDIQDHQVFLQPHINSATTTSSAATSEHTNNSDYTLTHQLVHQGALTNHFKNYTATTYDHDDAARASFYQQNLLSVPAPTSIFNTAGGGAAAASGTPRNGSNIIDHETSREVTVNTQSLISSGRSLSITTSRNFSSNKATVSGGAATEATTSKNSAPSGGRSGRGILVGAGRSVGCTRTRPRASTSTRFSSAGGAPPSKQAVVPFEHNLEQVVPSTSGPPPKELQADQSGAAGSCTSGVIFATSTGGPLAQLSSPPRAALAAADSGGPGPASSAVGRLVPLGLTTLVPRKMQHLFLAPRNCEDADEGTIKKQDYTRKKGDNYDSKNHMTAGTMLNRDQHTLSLQNNPPDSPPTTDDMMNRAAATTLLLQDDYNEGSPGAPDKNSEDARTAKKKMMHLVNTGKNTSAPGTCSRQAHDQGEVVRSSGGTSTKKSASSSYIRRQVIGNQVFSSCSNADANQKRKCWVSVTPFTFYNIDPCEETFTCTYRIDLEAEIPLAEWQLKTKGKFSTSASSAADNSTSGAGAETTAGASKSGSNPATTTSGKHDNSTGGRTTGGNPTNLKNYNSSREDQTSSSGEQLVQLQSSKNAAANKTRTPALLDEQHGASEEADAGAISASTREIERFSVKTNASSASVAQRNRGLSVETRGGVPRAQTSSLASSSQDGHNSRSSSIYDRPDVQLDSQPSSTSPDHHRATTSTPSGGGNVDHGEDHDHQTGNTTSTPVVVVVSKNRGDRHQTSCSSSNRVVQIGEDINHNEEGHTKNQHSEERGNLPHQENTSGKMNNNSEQNQNDSNESCNEKNFMQGSNFFTRAIMQLNRTRSSTEQALHGSSPSDPFSNSNNSRAGGGRAATERGGQAASNYDHKNFYPTNTSLAAGAATSRNFTSGSQLTSQQHQDHLREEQNWQVEEENNHNHQDPRTTSQPSSRAANEQDVPTVEGDDEHEERTTRYNEFRRRRIFKNSNGSGAPAGQQLHGENNQGGNNRFYNEQRGTNTNTAGERTTTNNSNSNSNSNDRLNRMNENSNSEENFKNENTNINGWSNQGGSSSSATNKNCSSGVVMKDQYVEEEKLLFPLPKFVHKNSIDLRIFWTSWTAEMLEREAAGVEVVPAPVEVSSCSQPEQQHLATPEGQGEHQPQTRAADDQAARGNIARERNVVLNKAEDRDAHERAQQQGDSTSSRMNCKNFSKDYNCYQEHSGSRASTRTRGPVSTTSSSATIARTQMLTSKCRTQFDLQAFPFDRQELRLVLFNLPQTGLNWDIIVERDHMARAVSALEISWKDPDWALIPGSFRVHRECHPVYGDRILVHVEVRRLWMWYIWNFFAILFLVTTLAFSGFVWEGFEEDGPARNPYDSIEIALLALLTIVSFKSYMSGSLPKVAYMTMLDVYTMASLTCCMATIVLTCIRIYFQLSYQHEVTMAFALYGLYTLFFHFFFVKKALKYVREQYAMEDMTGMYGRKKSGIFLPTSSFYNRFSTTTTSASRGNNATNNIFNGSSSSSCTVGEMDHHGRMRTSNLFGGAGGPSNDFALQLQEAIEVFGGAETSNRDSRNNVGQNQQGRREQGQHYARMSEENLKQLLPVTPPHDPTNNLLKNTTGEFMRRERRVSKSAPRKITRSQELVVHTGVSSGVVAGGEAASGEVLASRRSPRAGHEAQSRATEAATTPAATCGQQLPSTSEQNQNPKDQNLAHQESSQQVTIHPAPARGKNDLIAKPLGEVDARKDEVVPNNCLHQGVDHLLRISTETNELHPHNILQQSQHDYPAASRELHITNDSRTVPSATAHSPSNLHGVKKPAGSSNILTSFVSQFSSTFSRSKTSSRGAAAARPPQEQLSQPQPRPRGTSLTRASMSWEASNDWIGATNKHQF